MDSITIQELLKKNEKTIMEKCSTDPSIVDDLRSRIQDLINPDVSDTWQEYSLVDAYQSSTQEEYLVQGMIKIPSISAVFGKPGTFKSFLLSSLAISVASGKSWLPSENGNYLFPHIQQAGVMWCDFDNGLLRTHARFQALGRGENVPSEAPLTYYSMPTPYLDASNDDSINDLITRATRKEVKFLVLDNLGTISGGIEENSSKMIKVLSNLRRLSETIPAAVVVIHHQRKGSQNSTFKSETLRGHSSIEAALDLALLIERKADSDIINVSATKTRDQAILPFTVEFISDKDDRGNVISAKFLQVAKENPEGLSKFESIVINILSTEECNKTVLVNKVREECPFLGINRVRRLIGKMSKEQRIFIKEGRKTNEKIYFVG